jgi:putative ABC transport system permease protein
MNRFAFFLRHAAVHLLRERQRTLFVLFCIAAGVAAVVSLRTLGLMMGDALTRDLRMANRGDIAIQMPAQIAADGTGATVDQSLFTIEGDARGGQTITLSQEGEARLLTWATSRGLEAMPFWTNGGPFARLYQAGSSAAESIMLLCVDAAHYPYYGSVHVVQPDGATLLQALPTADSMAISTELAQALDLKPGNRVSLVGAAGDFTVSAIVDPNSESSLADPFFAVFPFAYLPYQTCLQEFQVRPNTYYLRAPAGADVEAAKRDLLAEFPGLQPTTTEDLRRANHEFSAALLRLTTAAGLISLLIGGIGIANTMIVTVSRRTLEIAVLKTLGLQAGQITWMFTLEALILGLVGGLLGLPLGLGLVLALKTFAERFVAQPMYLAVYPEALVMGLALGLVVTVAFGLLPTLSAGRVRPNRVLRLTESSLPRAGRGVSLLALLALTALIGLVVGPILGSLGLGLLLAYATILILGAALLLLRGVVWLITRLPSLGSISLKLAQRAVSEQPGRVASTLLSLVVGIFCLSLLSLLVQGSLQLVSDTALTFLGGNVLATVSSLEAGQALEREIARLPDVTFVHDRVYSAEVVAINGNRDVAALKRQALAAAGGENALGAPAAAIDDLVANFDMKVLDENTWPYHIAQGHDIAGRVSSPDAAPILLEPGAFDNRLAWFGLEPGDTLTLRFPQGEERRATIAGLTAPHSGGFLLQGLVDMRATWGIVPPGFVPEGATPQPSVYVLTVPDEDLNQTLDLLAGLPGIYMVAASELLTYTERFAQRFAPLPVIISALALFASSVILANTVSLATLERRRQIGIMKALGLQAESVLGLLLLENGLVGLTGGLLGTGLSTLVLVLSGALGEGRLPLTALGLLVLLAVGLTLGATLLTAYGAAREKPLNVLRYE